MKFSYSRFISQSITNILILKPTNCLYTFKPDSLTSSYIQAEQPKFRQQSLPGAIVPKSTSA